MAARKAFRSASPPRPLDARELDYLHYLLERATLNDQVPQSGPSSSTSMTDASKRVREAWESGDEGDRSNLQTVGEIVRDIIGSPSDSQSVTSEATAWSLVGSKKGYDYSCTRLQISHSGPPQVPLPAGVTSLRDWGSTVFQLPKFKEEQFSYDELICKGWNEKETLSYLVWLTNKYQGDRPQAGKASDFSAYVRSLGIELNTRLEILSSGRQRK